MGTTCCEADFFSIVCELSPSISHQHFLQKWTAKIMVSGEYCKFMGNNLLLIIAKMARAPKKGVLTHIFSTTCG
jgi:hypothetical protein